MAEKKQTTKSEKNLENKCFKCESYLWYKTKEGDKRVNYGCVKMDKNPSGTVVECSMYDPKRA